MKVYKNQRSFKRRRIELKKERASKQSSVEQREGTMYKSNCGEIPEEYLDTEYILESDDSENQSIHIENSIPTTKIYFDLETTGLGQHAEITQLSAWYSKEATFNRYIMPSRNTEKFASEITDLCIKHVRGHRRMFLKDKEVETVTSQADLIDFIQWLGNVPGDKKVLVAHNCKAFDMRILLRTLTENNFLPKFKTKCAGFVDTLPLLRAELPGRKSYKLQLVYKDVAGGSDFESHNARADAKALATIIECLNITEEKFIHYSLSMCSALDYINRRKHISLNNYQDCRRKTV